MSYLLNEPIATDRLSTSQPKLQGNTNQANTSFGNDHYSFADGTANNGKHKVIRTPAEASDPDTTDQPALYCKSVFTTQPQVLQFSRIKGNLTPSPLTTFTVTGTAAHATSPTLIDLAGAGAGTMIRCAILVTGAGVYNFNEFIFSYNGATFQSQVNPAPSNAVVPATVGGLTQLNASGSALVLQNISGANRTYTATISFIRIL